MSKKNIAYLTTLLILVVGILFSLVQWSDRPNLKKNNFERDWLTSSPTLIHNMNTVIPTSKISKITNHSVFLSGNDPRRLLITDLFLTKQDTININIPLTKGILSTNDIVVDSPNIYFYSTNYSNIYSCRFTDKPISLKKTKLETPIFTQSISILLHTLIVRAFDSTYKSQVFKKMNPTSGAFISQAKIINNQTDAGFSTDGFLRYDSSTNKVLYIQKYQNRFFCMDTNLALLYKGKTIDTTNTNLITVQLVKDNEGKSLMPTAPRWEVNTECCTNNGYLYIISGLKSDNENYSDFHKNSVIDVYDILNGAYKKSFYIPHIEKNKIKSFQVINNLIFALYSNQIAIYKISGLYE